MDISQAIRLAYQGRATQTEIAEALGVEQSTFSKWCRGVGAGPSLEQLGVIEVVTRRQRGWILRAVNDLGGLPIWTTLDAIAADPELDDAAKLALVGAYHGLIAGGHAKGTVNGTGRSKQRRA